METSDVRRRVTETVESARRQSAERRTRREAAAHEYDDLLGHRAIPLFRQVAGVLKLLGHSFTVATPAGGVRLASDSNPNEYVEILLDSTALEPIAMGRTSRTRGRNIVEAEQPVAPVPIREISEDQILEFLLESLKPLVER
jgi:hypothetical protein